MLKKIVSILFVIALFILSFIFFIPHNKNYKVIEISSPCDIKIDKVNFVIDDLTCFDTKFTAKNKELAEALKITEIEAFVLGNLGKYWAQNILKDRKIILKGDDLIYNRHSYKTKLLYSGFVFKDNRPINEQSYNYYLKSFRKGYFRVLDLETNNVYKIDDVEVKNLDKFLVLRSYSLPLKRKIIAKQRIKSPAKSVKKGSIKVFFTDHTDKITLDNKCELDVCKEILNNIKVAQKSIDIAIYGYSQVPDIEEALKDAISRNVIVRLVYDADRNGENIYPDTNHLASLIGNSRSDKDSIESGSKMHNKFYIFDDKTVILGSANLSQTDMSGFNSNCVISLENEKIAQVYKKEFNQMYDGKFHNTKTASLFNNFIIDDIEAKVFFSPQDKGIEKAILPIIDNAKDYIYIPIFVLTEKRVANSLVQAQKRGVRVRLIMDALSSSTNHSKIDALRKANIEVKTENYAGKMHSKSMIIDDEYTIIGSMNFSDSGENKNDENFIVLKDKEIAQAYRKFFDYQWDKIDDKWLKFKVRAEGKDSIGSCSDGLDNNYDDLIDKLDPACKW